MLKLRACRSLKAVLVGLHHHCWQAADFYSSSLTRDRYWYLESLVTAYCAGVNYSVRTSEMPLLYEAIIRDAWSVGREDKIILVSKARNGIHNMLHLLTDLVR
jgi:hypothetical protein